MYLVESSSNVKSKLIKTRCRNLIENVCLSDYLCMYILNTHFQIRLHYYSILLNTFHI